MMMTVTQTKPSTTVILLRLRSATPDEFIELVTPPSEHLCDTTTTALVEQNHQD